LCSVVVVVVVVIIACEIVGGSNSCGGVLVDVVIVGVYVRSKGHIDVID